MEFGKGKISCAKATQAGDFGTWQFRMGPSLKGIDVYCIVDGSENYIFNPYMATAVSVNTSLDPSVTRTAAVETPGVRAPVNKNPIKEYKEYRILCDTDCMVHSTGTIK